MEQTLTDSLNPERCWQAVHERDATFDGHFFYGVTTTGVYCRPSCGARLPRRHNVRFFATAEQARAAGFRACKRCRPDAPRRDDELERVAALCRWIEAHADEPEALTLEALGRRAKLSPSHLQRRFQGVVGLSPKAYAEACRLHRLKDGLRAAPRITDAIYDAGFGSGSRVYERIGTRLGMTPSAYRAGGAGLTMTYAITVTALGPTLIAATDRGICSVAFAEDEATLLRQLAAEFPRAERIPMAEPRQPLFETWMAALAARLEGREPDRGLPLDTRGTAFQLKVWKALLEIPSGAVKSYAEVAQAIGAPSAARAVARACASNRLAVLIPCHRVIRGDGALGGYRWGLERKRALIGAERARAAAG